MSTGFYQQRFAGLDSIFCTAITLWVIRTGSDTMKVPFCTESLKSSLLNGGPLSLIKVTGIPCLENHDFKTVITRVLVVWSAICFKIMTRYTCGFFPRILAIIPATRYTCVFCHVYLRSFLLCGVFIPKYMTIFLQTRIYIRTEKPIYMRYKQACGICRAVQKLLQFSQKVA